MGTAYLDVTKEADVLAALQEHLDRTTAPDKVARLLDAAPTDDEPAKLYWHKHRPPLASAWMELSSDKKIIGIGVRLLLLTYRQEEDDPKLPHGFVERLELRLAGTSSGVRFEQKEPFGYIAYLFVLSDFLRDAHCPFRIVAS